MCMIDDGDEAPLSQVYTCVGFFRVEKARRHHMDVFTFLFETREGVGILFAAGVLIFCIVAFVMEKRTHKLYVDRGPKKDDEDGFWD